MIKRRLHPIDKEILRALIGTKIKVTPSKISKVIGVHPVTAQNRIKELMKQDLVRCNSRGNRTYCKANLPELKRKLIKINKCRR